MNFDNSDFTELIISDEKEAVLSQLDQTTKLESEKDQCINKNLNSDFVIQEKETTLLEEIKSEFEILKDQQKKLMK